MKQHKFVLSMLGILLASSACLAASAAYAKDNDRDKDRGRTEKKGEKDRGQAEKKGDKDLLQGVPHSVTLTNASSMTLKEVDVRLGGKDRTDFTQSNNCGEELKGNTSCIINVTFLPRSPGAKSATMEVHTSGGNQTVYLTGTGM